MKSLVCAGGLLLAATAGAQTLAPGVTKVPVATGYARANLNSGSFSRHSLVSWGPTQYIVFYNPNTNVVVGRRALGATNWEFHATTFRPNNALDGHDSSDIGISADGILHCSWGMHADAFHYARSVAPWSLVLVATNMTTFENNVTYPQFLHLPNGDLLYLFREGGSGAGDTYLNRYSAASHTWTNVNYNGGQKPFIDGTTLAASNYCNAYPNFAGFDSQTNLHLTWCWREDAATIDTNHDTLYGRTPDYGVTWQRWNGSNYALPITKENADNIWPISTNSTLMNQSGQCIDRNDRPVIANWWAPGGSGTPLQYFIIWNDGAQWRTNQIGQRTTTNWPRRPIVVADASNRLLIVYSDPESGNVPMLAWTDDPQRAAWRFAALSTESLAGWEPTYDPVLWEREGKLHLFIQSFTGSLTGSPIHVLEFDPDVFFANPPETPATYAWRDTAGTNLWSDGASWTNDAAPPAGGSNRLALRFGGGAAYTASNDLPGVFALNALTLEATGVPRRLEGGPLAFRPNGATAPVFAQNGAAPFQVDNPLAVSGRLAVMLAGPGAVTLAGAVSGDGGLSVTGGGRLELAASNTFSGGVTWSGGTLVLGEGGLGSGPFSGGGGVIRWRPGAAYDFAAGRANTLTATVTLDPGGGDMTLAGALEGGGGLTLRAAADGSVTLAGSNAYAGVTTVTTGRLVAAHAAALGTTGANTVAPGGNATSGLGLRGGIVLPEPIRCGGRQPVPMSAAFAPHVVNLDGTNTLTGGLTAETGGNMYTLESAAGLFVVACGYRQIAGTGPRHLKLQGDADGLWAGAIGDGTASINVVKRGPGRWTLAGTNTYTGATVASNGVLVVNGRVGTNVAEVCAGGTLGGTGVVGGRVTVRAGGTLAPGDPAGTFTLSRSLTLAPGATARFALGSTSAAVAVGGDLVLDGTLEVVDAGGFGATNYALFTYGGQLTGSLALATMPPSYCGALDTGTPGLVRLAVTPLRMNALGPAGPAFVVGGSGGPAGGAFVVLASTNLVVPPVQWTEWATGQFDTAGAFLTTNVLWPDAATLFYRLRQP